MWYVWFYCRLWRLLLSDLLGCTSALPGTAVRRWVNALHRGRDGKGGFPFPSHVKMLRRGGIVHELLSIAEGPWFVFFSSTSWRPCTFFINVSGYSLCFGVVLSMFGSLVVVLVGCDEATLVLSLLAFGQHLPLCPTVRRPSSLDKRLGILFGVGISRCCFLHPWVVDDGGSSSSLQTGPLSLLYRIPRASREGHRHSSSGSTFSLCSVLELYLFVRCESTLVSTCHVALLI
jgi:hypothetical protein